jgi:hypothetical protein
MALMLVLLCCKQNYKRIHEDWLFKSSLISESIIAVAPQTIWSDNLKQGTEVFFI